MYFNLFLLVCVLACAACREANPTTSPTYPSAPTPTNTAVAEEQYIETLTNGIRLGIIVPAGWKAHRTQKGLLMTERYSPEAAMMGIEVHVFVYSTSGFDVPQDESINSALYILTQIIQQPSYVVEGTVSEPQGFDWDRHDAAYYLLNNGDGNVTMLVAVTIENPPRLIVCNISSPDAHSQSIRWILPNLLGSLTINGMTMSLEAVNALPNPLVFPTYRPRPETTAEATEDW